MGHLLDVDPSHFGFWPGLIHAVLLHQLHYPGTSELVFKFADTMTRFGCQQFCIVTGLPYVGQSEFPPSSGRLLKRYGRGGKLRRESLLEAFTRCTDRVDQVKLGVAYLVEGLIFSKAKSIFVRPEILGLVDDLEAFNRVAWGRLGWEYMAPTLKECIVSKKSNFSGTYAVKGFFDSLSAFAMECLPDLSKLGVQRVGHNIPRMANWKMGHRYPFPNLLATVFSQVRTLEFTSLSCLHVISATLHNSNLNNFFSQPMNVFEIQLTVEEAEHPNLARIGDAAEKNEGQSADDFLNLAASVREGQSERRREPAKTVCIAQCHQLLFRHMYGIVQYDISFNTV